MKSERSDGGSRDLTLFLGTKGASIYKVQQISGFFTPSLFLTAKYTLFAANLGYFLTPLIPLLFGRGRLNNGSLRSTTASLSWTAVTEWIGTREAPVLGEDNFLADVRGRGQRKEAEGISQVRRPQNEGPARKVCCFFPMKIFLIDHLKLKVISLVFNHQDELVPDE